MALRNFANEVDPVINVIEQDFPVNSGGLAASDDRRGRLESAAIAAVSARRRREFDVARARLREQAIRDDAATLQKVETRSPSATPADMDLTSVPLDQPPERVRKRYLRAGNQYFLKDAPYQLAFEDLGPYLVTEHNRPDVVESMIDMVHAKSWRRIRVSGHEMFRNEAWLQGTLLGIEVSGYQPKAEDLARLTDARHARLDNRIAVVAQVGAPTAASAPARADNPAMVSSAPRVDVGTNGDPNSPSTSVRELASEPPIPEGSQSAANDEADLPRRYVGELCEHGGAPYQHNPARSDSYYVVFRDEAGVEQVVWGVDLERAVREANAQIGQQVTLENLGKRLVTVRMPILNDEGRVIGEDEKVVHRNTWQVGIVQRGHDVVAPQKADYSQNGQTRSTDSLGARVDETALYGSHDARHLGSERALHVAVLTAAMREQGFSERSVTRVRQHAERMLAAFQREGIPVPAPKVFDPSAPSGRNRRKHQAPERTPARELELTPDEPSRSSPSR
ncbi:TPA: DNA primase [Burkholderia aenigmatica]|uniref:LPD7 domain-containing protein n=1 Tax=Burkholderia sp. AU45251 TaxID=3059204 RepID=UPI00265677EF|nr:LPD7 domain-containing protein [Burkholderia sp. AU45251]HDR9483099.1 DNA primase [Burkholderia aenigmatica]MDN7515963.1 DNA primase [Burkholderia sp. AU45251]HDR9514047.1 DNA primase [Burkholderia aenigmatica]HDR9591437.1 DNA primase [Burkholderia aenigmatica]HDR9598529.1 DNA primase [Burkholderia aenigmatica]